MFIVEEDQPTDLLVAHSWVYKSNPPPHLSNRAPPPAGFISMEDFRQTWKLLSVYLKMEITDEAISDLAVTIDSNQDGSIDIDEFMEAFRLTDKKSRLERGRSMFMGTATDLTKMDVDPNIWKWRAGLRSIRARETLA